MNRRQAVVALALSSVAWSASAGQATIRGKVLHGSAGVPKVALSLIGDRPGMTLVSRDRITTVTAADGSFSIDKVDATAKWALVVWDPYRSGRIATRVTVDPTKENVIYLKRLIRFTEPGDKAYLTSPTFDVKWTTLPGAARHRLTISDFEFRPVSVLETTSPFTSVTLRPGQIYGLSVSSFDSAGAEVAADIVYEGRVFRVGVADPAVERALKPATGQCGVKAERVALRVAPSKYPRSETSISVSAGDSARLLGTHRGWSKVELTRGSFPGSVGWIESGGLACAHAPDGSAGS